MERKEKVRVRALSRCPHRNTGQPRGKRHARWPRMHKAHWEWYRSRNQREKQQQAHTIDFSEREKPAIVRLAHGGKPKQKEAGILCPRRLGVAVPGHQFS